MPQCPGDAKARHPAPVAAGHRFPEPDAHGGHDDRAGGAGPEKGRGRAVAPRRIAGQQAVKREHRRGGQRDHGGGVEDTGAGAQDDQHADKAHPDRRPSPPAHLFAQDRPGQRRHQERVTGEDRVAFDQAQDGEGGDHDADLGRQKNAARGLHQRLVGARRGADAARLARGDRDHEGREEPVADHHDHQDVVFARQVARDAVLQREDDRRRDHQQDAQPRVVARAHVVFAATVMCRLRPYPGRRSTASPASASARRTNPAAV